MKLLFFDMEFANGQIAGSVYSFGYMMTDDNFNVLHPREDILIDPDAVWNEYVEKNILAYPKEEVENAPKFPEHYDFVKSLFDEADIVVGFAIANDNRALRKDCMRYGLSPIDYKWFDTERLCKLTDEHKDARGLGGCVLAWCGEEPDDRHRSDGDAYATMCLMQAICRSLHVTPDMLIEAYPECVGDTSVKEKMTEKPKKTKAPRRRRRRGGKPKSTVQTLAEA